MTQLELILICLLLISTSLLLRYWVYNWVEQKHVQPIYDPKATPFLILKTYDPDKLIPDKYYVWFNKWPGTALKTGDYCCLRRHGDTYILDTMPFATPFFSKEEAVKAAEDFIKSQQLVKV